MFEIPAKSFSSFNLSKKRLLAPHADVEGQYFTINVNS